MGETQHATHNQYDECICQCLPLVNLLDFRVKALVSQEEKQRKIKIKPTVAEIRLMQWNKQDKMALQVCSLPLETCT